jgi:hypothetical protein
MNWNDIVSLAPEHGFLVLIVGLMLGASSAILYENILAEVLISVNGKTEFSTRDH